MEELRMQNAKSSSLPTTMQNEQTWDELGKED